MTAEQAAELCGVLRPRVAVPIHYRYTAGPLRDRLLLRYDGTPERFVTTLAWLAPTNAGEDPRVRRAHDRPGRDAPVMQAGVGSSDMVGERFLLAPHTAPARRAAAPSSWSPKQPTRPLAVTGVRDLARLLLVFVLVVGARATHVPGSVLLAATVNPAADPGIALVHRGWEATAHGVHKVTAAALLATFALLPAPSSDRRERNASRCASAPDRTDRGRLQRRSLHLVDDPQAAGSSNAGRSPTSSACCNSAPSPRTSVRLRP